MGLYEVPLSMSGFGMWATGYKTGTRYSQNASVQGSGQVPKSVHWSIILSAKNCPKHIRYPRNNWHGCNL